jgi:acyl-lipid omega-3 desaturase
MYRPRDRSVCALQSITERVGRLLFPLPLFAYPFYLWSRSPGKSGSHYDPSCDLFTPHEKNMVLTSNAFMLGMLAILGFCTFQLGPLAMFNLYFVPYWVNVLWLDLVTYLHHHGPQDKDEKMPWYRYAFWRKMLPSFPCALYQVVCGASMPKNCAGVASFD